MKRCLLLFIITCPLVADTGSQTFSEAAWQRIAPIYQAIRIHPFNQKLADGSLGKAQFTYYSTQDTLYFVEYGKTLAILATKLEGREEIRNVFKEAMSCWNEEKDAQEKKAKQSIPMAPATLLYTDFLLSTAAYRSREELVAAVLPCFWIYSQLAREMKGLVGSKNPYRDWVTFYSSDKYKRSVDRMIALADDLANRVSPEQRSKMIDAFMMASRMEWCFWDGAYRMETWKPELSR